MGEAARFGGTLRLAVRSSPLATGQKSLKDYFGVTKRTTSQLESADDESPEATSPAPATPPRRSCRKLERELSAPKTAPKRKQWPSDIFCEQESLQGSACTSLDDFTPAHVEPCSSPVKRSSAELASQSKLAPKRRRISGNCHTTLVDPMGVASSSYVPVALESFGGHDQMAARHAVSSSASSSSSKSMASSWPNICGKAGSNRGAITPSIDIDSTTDLEEVPSPSLYECNEAELRGEISEV